MCMLALPIISLVLTNISRINDETYKGRDKKKHVSVFDALGNPSASI